MDPNHDIEAIEGAVLVAVITVIVVMLISLPRCHSCIQTWVLRTYAILVIVAAIDELTQSNMFVYLQMMWSVPLFIIYTSIVFLIQYLHDMYCTQHTEHGLFCQVINATLSMFIPDVAIY